MTFKLRLETALFQSPKRLGTAPMQKEARPGGAGGQQGQEPGRTWGRRGLLLQAGGTANVGPMPRAHHTLRGL